MLKLSGQVISITAVDQAVYGVPLRVSTGASPAAGEPSKTAFLIQTSNPPHGCAAYLLPNVLHNMDFSAMPWVSPLIELPEEFGYLEDGDIVSISARESRIRVLYRRQSPHNSFLVTERCDNYCLMCSQPPKDVNDDWVIQEILDAIPLIDPLTKELGFTGGEPTLLGEKFLEVLRSCRDNLPSTAIHVLSNGRRFSDNRFAAAWADVDHHDLMVGIPIYSAISNIHDFVVQADGAYDQTIRGVLNLKRQNQKVEIRVVLHAHTAHGLVHLANFIVRNLLFVDHVALMGLEIMGFTRANLNQLWIDPTDYQAQLVEATQILDDAGLRVSIYNHQLCLLDPRIWRFAVKSISDWKNEYLSECAKCSVRERCGGFFSSAKFKRSGKIRAL